MRPFDVLEAILKIIITNGKVNPVISGEALVHWLAYKLKVEPGIVSPTFDQATWDELERIDLAPLQQKPEDYLGRFLWRKNLLKVETILPKVSYDHHVLRNVHNMSADGTNRVLDTCGGTGGMMISMFDLLSKNTVVYMAEPDLFQYRIALVNAKLFNIPSRILCADYRQHDLTTDSQNWRHANLWIPKAPGKLLAANA